MNELKIEAEQSNKERIEYNNNLYIATISIWFYCLMFMIFIILFYHLVKYFIRKYKKKFKSEYRIGRINTR